jgi:transcription antitermination protein NusB
MSLKSIRARVSILNVYSTLSRRDLRALLFQLLYAVESDEYSTPLETIVQLINEGYDLDIPLKSEVVQTAHNIIENRHFLDEEIKPLLQNWRFERVSVITKLILYIALWELKQGILDTSIVINEAVELAKCFAEKDAYKFINGILDKKVHQ